MIPNLYLMVTCHRPLVLPLAAPTSPSFIPFLVFFPSRAGHVSLCVSLLCVLGWLHQGPGYRGVPQPHFPSPPELAVSCGACSNYPVHPGPNPHLDLNLWGLSSSDSYDEAGSRTEKEREDSTLATQTSCTGSIAGELVRNAESRAPPQT